MGMSRGVAAARAERAVAGSGRPLSAVGSGRDSLPDGLLHAAVQQGAELLIAAHVAAASGHQLAVVVLGRRLRKVALQRLRPRRVLSAGASGREFPTTSPWQGRPASASPASGRTGSKPDRGRSTGPAAPAPSPWPSPAPGRGRRVRLPLGQLSSCRQRAGRGWARTFVSAVPQLGVRAAPASPA